MECRDAMDLMLSLDNAGAPPPDLAAHLRGCARCRAEFGRLNAAVVALEIGHADSAATELTNTVLTERIMEAVRHDAAAVMTGDEALSEEERPELFRNWIIAGTLLVAGLFGLRFSDVMDWLRNSFGPTIDVAMSLILGVFLTGYICMLVGSNLRRVRRALRLR